MFVLYTNTLFLLSFINFCHCKNYHNYILLRALPTSDEHLEFLNNLTEIYDANIWHEPGLKNKHVDFVISPNYYSNFAEKAKTLGVKYDKVIDNIENAFRMQSVKSYVRRNMQSFDWNSYYRLNDMYQWLRDLSNKYKEEMELFRIAKTAEGRDILCAKIKLKGALTSGQAVVVEAGIHAREWVSPAFGTYFLNQIVTAGDSHDKELKHLALSYTWYFVPMLNPDGYEYTHTKDRLWRKNRNPHGGVDINRNFDSAFGTSGISWDKNKDTYCGEHAFSEPESRGIRDLLRKLKSVQYYIAFHAYGQYMILPYAYSKEHVLNYDEVAAKGKLANAAIGRRYNTQFTIGTAYDTVSYMTSGVSACWVKKTFKTPYVMVFELRDSGTYGFALPSSQIYPTCLEMMDGMRAFITPCRLEKLSIATDPLTDQAPYVISSSVVTLILNYFLCIIFD